MNFLFIFFIREATIPQKVIFEEEKISAIYEIPDFLTLWKTGSLQAQNRYILSFEKT